MTGVQRFLAAFVERVVAIRYPEYGINRARAPHW